MGRSPDELAEEMLVRYMRITGVIPSFRDYLDARSAALRETQSVPLAQMPPIAPVSSVQIQSIMPAPPARIQQIASVQAQAAPAMCGQAAPAMCGGSAGQARPASVLQELHGENNPVKPKSDFEILHELKDEWN